MSLKRVNPYGFNIEKDTITQSKIYETLDVVFTIKCKEYIMANVGGKLYFQCCGFLWDRGGELLDDSLVPPNIQIRAIQRELLEGYTTPGWYWSITRGPDKLVVGKSFDCYVNDEYRFSNTTRTAENDIYGANDYNDDKLYDFVPGGVYKIRLFFKK